MRGVAGQRSMMRPAHTDDLGQQVRIDGTGLSPEME
jgi:hypothetical protein